MFVSECPVYAEYDLNRDDYCLKTGGMHPEDYKQAKRNNGNSQDSEMPVH